MTTANTLIADALSSLGILGSASVVSGNDALLGLRVLNRLLDAITMQPNTSLYAGWTVFTLPPNTTSRTIGPGAQVDATRPIRVEPGSFVRIEGIDRPLTPVGRDVYGSIDLKSMGGYWPTTVYYEPSMPTGTLNFWPPSTATVEVHLAVRTQLTRFANLTTDYVLPPGYESYLVSNLAVRMAPHFEREAPAAVQLEARATSIAMKRANAMVPDLAVDASPMRSRLGEFLGGG